MGPGPTPTRWNAKRNVILALQQGEGLHKWTYDERRQTECDYDDCVVRNISCIGEQRVRAVSWLVRDLCISATERHLADWKVIRLPE